MIISSLIKKFLAPADPPIINSKKSVRRYYSARASVAGAYLRRARVAWQAPCEATYVRRWYSAKGHLDDMWMCCLLTNSPSSIVLCVDESPWSDLFPSPSCHGPSLQPLSTGSRSDGSEKEWWLVRNMLQVSRNWNRKRKESTAGSSNLRLQT